jgi:hypothetical protein
MPQRNSLKKVSKAQVDRFSRQAMGHRINLKAQHLTEGLDPDDLKHLDTPPHYAQPKVFKGVCID